MPEELKIQDVKGVYLEFSNTFEIMATIKNGKGKEVEFSIEPGLELFKRVPVAELSFDWQRVYCEFHAGDVDRADLTVAVEELKETVTVAK